MAQTYNTLSNIPFENITSENAFALAEKLAKDPSFTNPTLGNSSGGSPKPGKVSMSTIKSNLLRPALTSHYQCWFNPPSSFRKWLERKDIRYEGNEILVSLSCSEAVLPGSTMMTNEINDDFTGVTERHAYRRQFDDRADFTFYVNHNDDGGKDYYIIKFFEYWLSYMSGEELTEKLEDTNYFYRVNYPKDYQSPAIYVNKFEKDYSGRYLEYRLLQAYPISISSMPVSYESSQLLKCTVSFTYTRYLVNLMQYPSTKASKVGDQLGFYTEQGSFVVIPPLRPSQSPQGPPVPGVPVPLEVKKYSLF